MPLRCRRPRTVMLPWTGHRRAAVALARLIKVPSRNSLWTEWRRGDGDHEKDVENEMTSIGVGAEIARQ